MIGSSHISSSLPGRNTVYSCVALLAFVSACLAAAALSALWTNSSVETWYSSLRKPSWSPPDWVFGPVWTCLYVMMAFAAWLVWRKKGWRGARWSLSLFVVQLILNAVWSPLFFSYRSPGLAFADIVLLWLAIVATALAFYRASSLAAALLMPYLAWVTFAGALNWAIWTANA